MQYQNPFSSQTFQKILDYELHEPLDDKQQERRLQVLEKVNNKIEQIKTDYPNKKSQLEKRVLTPCFSDWRLFSAVVSSVKHFTQKGGEDDYLLLSYEENKKTLYIAREMFLGLSLDLVTEFLFRELSQDKIQPLQSKQQAEINNYIQNLIKSRVIPYDLSKIVETLIDWVTEERVSIGLGEEIESKRRAIYAQRLRTELDSIMWIKPRSIRDFTKFLTNAEKQRCLISSQEIIMKLEQMGIWDAKLHQLLRTLRINLAEGDTEELFYNSAEYRLIKQDFLTNPNDLGRWLELEENAFLGKYNEFIEELEEELSESQKRYKESIKKEDPQEAQKIKNKLIELRSYFSDLLDPSTRQFVCKLDLAIKEMGLCVIPKP